MKKRETTHREKLVAHVQALEQLIQVKQEAIGDLADQFKLARSDGFDPATLRVVIRLRTLTPRQRRERRALEAIYLATLGMLEGDPLPDAARRRLAGEPDDPTPGPAATEAPPDTAAAAPSADGPAPVPAGPAQPLLPLKQPAEARAEGELAAGAGKRIYDNPYRAGDPCRAAWDEGWCVGRGSHGMDTPAVYQRRTPKAPGMEAAPADPATPDQAPPPADASPADQAAEGGS